MECLILAAGAGSRLHPLTLRHPKPLLPLGDSTILGRLVSQVAELPLKRVLCNLHHRAEAAQEYFENTELALPVETRVEEAPRGPSGSMHTFHDELAATDLVVVLSGDLYLRGDLTELVRAHQESGALLTVLATEVDDGSRFGVFQLDQEGRPVDLVEKPDWARNRRSWVSGGAYCVDPSLLAEIPADRPHDFGADLIPALLARGAPVTLVPWLGRWDDLGTVEAYRSAVLDDLADPADRGRPVTHVSPGAVVRPGAEFTGRVYIGPGAEVGAGARLHETVLLPGARVAPGTVVAGGCLA
ncbi:NDP-sugar synthase [Streptomyces sp. NPDC001985]|uniref:nucleotidyltransferase family protein n=1 Tax=Streptomyces sp. NPDC001985 TaxID=3154406 RepID=UPI003320E8BA